MSASYYVQVHKPGCDRGESCRCPFSDSVNVTYNLGPMLRAAGLPSWEVLDDAPCAEVAGVLDGVVRRLVENRSELEREHTPPNGWGSWGWAYDWASRLRDMAADWAHVPDARLGSSR